MISAATAISWVLQLYDFAMGLKFDHVEHEADDEGISWGYASIEGDDLVVFRGSRTIEDWARDLLAVPETVDDPRLGLVHAGFFMGMEEAVAAIKPRLRVSAPLTVAGHSLGAARGFYAAAMLIADHPSSASGRRPSAGSGHRLYAFGSPSPGIGAGVRDALPSGIDARSYRNGADPVPWLPPPALGWRQPVAMSEVCEPPSLADYFGHLGWHHSTLYAKAFGVTAP